MKKREIILVIAALIFGLIYQASKSGGVRWIFRDHSINRELLDKSNLCPFPQKEIRLQASDAATIKELRLKNIAGDIDIVPSTDGSIIIQPIINVYHKNKTKAGKMAGSISVNSRQKDSKLFVDVSYQERFPYNNVRLSFKCLVPSNVAVYLVNQLGNIAVNDMVNDVTVRQEYGELFIKNITGAVNARNEGGMTRIYDITGSSIVSSSFGELIIKNAPSVSLKCRHSQVSLQDIVEKTIISNSSFSNLSFENCGQVVIEDGKQSNITANGILNGMTIADNSHATLKLKQISGNVSINTRHCEILLDGVTADDISVKNTYNDVLMDNITCKNLNVTLESSHFDLGFNAISENVMVNGEHCGVTLKYPQIVKPSFAISVKNGTIVAQTTASLPIETHGSDSQLNVQADKPVVTITTSYGDVTIRDSKTQKVEEPSKPETETFENAI